MWKAASAYFPWPSIALIVKLYVASVSGTTPIIILLLFPNSRIPGGKSPATSWYEIGVPSGSFKKEIQEGEA